MLLGAHMSIAGGVDQAPLRGRAVGCQAIQLFTKNNTQWRAEPISPAEVQAYRANLQEAGIALAVAHNSYLINLGTPDPLLRRRSLEAFRIELERAEALGIPYLVAHPGSHLGKGEREGLKRIAEGLDRLLEEAQAPHVQVVLETTAGQGTSLGYRFEQLALLFELTERGKGLGVCLDTCHIFAAGYDIRTEKGYRKTMEEFDRIIGLDRLKLLHLNDSKKGLGCRVDRHEHIGQGCLGLAAFRLIMNDDRLQGLPMILETPKGNDFVRADRRNLLTLRRLRGEQEARRR